jgi:ferredoxin
MLRQIIKIDAEKCNGCGLCAEACHEGAIGMVDGRAKLLREDYCDGLGNCLPVCPTGAITFEEREAAAFDSVAAGGDACLDLESNGAGGNDLAPEPEKPEPFCGGRTGYDSTEVEGSATVLGCSQQTPCEQTPPKTAPGSPAPDDAVGLSALRQWPIQIRLAPVNAPYIDGAHLLVSADCAAFAHGDFHRAFMRNKIALIGCPKLDGVDYSEKLTEIIAGNNIKSVTVVRMEVPCCGGIEHAVVTALKNSGKMIPWQVVTLKINGDVLED